MLIQLLMVAILIAVPQVVSIKPAVKVMPQDINIEVPLPAYEDREPPLSIPTDDNEASGPRK